MNTDRAKLEALQTYFDLMSMNGGARVYRTARDLGIFDAMSAGARTTSEIATTCGLCERPLEVLLDVLVSLRTLTCHDHTYALTPVMQFLQGSYKNLSDEYWDHLPHLLRSGEPLAKMDSDEQSEQQYTKQVTALAWMMKPAAEAAATMLEIGTNRRDLHILDVGAGSAVWSLTFAAKDAEATVTALDWEGVLKIASAAAQNMGLQDRFTPLPGNYHDTELTQDAYDLAIVANVTHIETPEGNARLFRKLLTAMKPHGELVIVDVMPGQANGDLARALYAMGLTLRTQRGCVYSREELVSFLDQAGFVNATFIPIPVPPHTMGMIVARRDA